MKTSVTPIFRRAALLAAVSLAASGCANLQGDAPNFDSKFGATFKQAMAQQVMHPNAGQTAKTTATFDGKAAVALMNEYRDSFKAPPPSFAVLGIGGGIAATGR